MLKKKSTIIAFIFTVGFIVSFFIAKTIIIKNYASNLLASTNGYKSVVESSPNFEAELIAKQILTEKIQEELAQEKSREQSVVKNSSCLTPKKEYKDQSFLNVDQNISLPDASYVPQDLTLVEKKYSTSNICLKKDASDALAIMLEKATKDGLRIKISSGFRSYNTQNEILKRNLKNTKSETSVAVAKAGYSEHQLGTTGDLTGASIGYSTASGKFSESPESKWLEKNAYKYGFIQSYPKGKESITGYMYESWHYRYVGVETAKEVIKSGKTLNEYLGGL